MALPPLALVFATIERPQTVQRLVRSIRRYCPDLPVYAADQSRQVEAMRAFYAANNVTLIRMPYDAGVAASRNRLAQSVAEDFFVLCDDDFVLGPRTGFHDALQIMQRRPEIGVVGGRLYDFDGKEQWLRNWEIFLEYDAAHRILFSVPIYKVAPRVGEVGRVRYYLCDAVLNFAVFRRSMFANGVRWDEQFTCNGEHEDFFLNLKVNTGYRVAHLPTMVAYHHHPEEFKAYRQRLRDRDRGWKRFLEKWNIDQHLEMGFGVRTVDDVSTVVSEEDVQRRFFLNANLSLRRDKPASDVVVIDSYKRLATVDTLDELGNRAGGELEKGRLLLDVHTKDIVTTRTRDTTDPPPSAAGVESRAVLMARYGLENTGEGRIVGFTQKDIYFRYDAILRPDADFFLWYTCRHGGNGETRSERKLAVVARWTAVGGSCLVWRSRPAFIDLDTEDYWRPIHLNLPTLPRGCAWLRFDIMTDDGANSRSIGSGFLFSVPELRGISRPALDSAGYEVLGISRIPGDGTAPGRAGRPLEEVGRDCAKVAATVHSLDANGKVSILPTEQLGGLEVLFFAGWQSLGRALVSARLPEKALSSPAALALPGEDWRSPDSRVYGYGRSRGFVNLVCAVA